MDTLSRLHDLLNTLENLIEGISDTLNGIDFTVESSERDYLMSMIYTRLCDVSNRVGTSLRFDPESVMNEIRRMEVKETVMKGY